MAGGRPTKMTEETVQKLEEAFEMGCTDVEACLHAGIVKQTLYNYQEENPEFVDRKQALKENPAYRARKVMYEAIKNDKNLNTAQWYLERKKKDEFSQRTESDVNTKISFDTMDDKELDGLIESLSQETDE
jgi:hypothetical protein